MVGTRKAAAPEARVPRPPLSARSDPNSTAAPRGGASTVAAMSETQVRRRLAQVEMRLRDMDDEARRVHALQEQEVATLKRDNMKLRERLEVIRMEECMSLTEARALQEYASHHRVAPGAPTGQSESKLIGSTTVKYQRAKAEVQDRRRECAQAERQLAEARAQLADVRKRRKELKQRSLSVEMSAAARTAAADSYRALIHERLRSLEEQVAREQERLNHFLIEAKEVRVEVDALLVNQTSNEKMYRSRHDALLMKRREMAYLMEVCNLLCEERERVVAQLTEVQARMAEESRQYEAAFDELTGVQAESAKAKAANLEQLEELRRIIGQTRAEREALDADNHSAKATIQHQRRRTVLRHLSDAVSAGNTSEASLGCTTVGQESGVATASGAGGVSGDGSEGLRTPESALSLDGSQQQIRIFEDYYRRLCAIVQSDAIEDVTCFMDAAADERYKSFDEMNAIKRDMAALRVEKAALMAQLSRGNGARAAAAFFDAGGSEAPANALKPMRQPFTPTSSLAALAGADTLEELAAVTATVAAEKRGWPSVPGAPTGGSQERAARVANLLDDLGATRDLVCDQEEEQEASSAVLAQVVALVKEVFRGLGCSTDELRALTGMEGVQQSTLLKSLAMIEQRASEYLVAYSLQQQRLAAQTSGDWPEVQAQATMTTVPFTRNAARSLLRRLDLQPRAAKNAVAATVAQQALPRSTDLMTVMSTADALATGSSAAVEDLVGERPLSKAELKRIVASKRAPLQQ
ncbi:hypothetical protein LSCM1_08014 [Leishmania martiniquensis]|uniref:Uncharacterized protein n=1 Tax=Leishmania martiniquensis TaxID=1580590 RepID=A0A836L2W5_9TRYP|nr:hypothetical protein LSCM1_08014 [Leishmania martiniquensis]